MDSSHLTRHSSHSISDPYNRTITTTTSIKMDSNVTSALISIGLPKNYGWVALAASSTYFLNVYQMINVSKARKRAGIPYPKTYCEDKENKAGHIFNCAQRAHLNTLESVPYVLFGILFSGLFFPRLAASLGAVWTFGRVIYTMGYTTGDPSKRFYGFFQSIAFLTIGGLSAYSSVQLILDQA
ncbi:hypothetical protein E3P84_02739 [Wallemia ichthyophaga]|nr:hypothetical protein E3P84_02739 [Wallemia ichthyophaga]TIB40726.1 hypothetical protein E3P83_02676 [Wallemia ichthyophaga]